MIFKTKYGIIPACDVRNLDELELFVKSTCSLNFIVGYKIGSLLALSYGIKKVVNVIRSYTDLPIIYDHQKFGTDIPAICSGEILSFLKEVGINALIIFPLSGIETLKASIEGCLKNNIVPLVGGEMTHPGYLTDEGGYIEVTRPKRMYLDACELGVKGFVIPGTKIKKMEEYKREIEKIVSQPYFLFPGIGKGQGGDIVAAFKAIYPHAGYAIVGRGIYAKVDKKRAAEKLWKKVISEFGKFLKIIY